MTRRKSTAAKGPAQPFTRPPEAVPPVAANRFWVTASDRVRLSFGEAGPAGDVYHQAVSLSRADALELAGTLARLLVEAQAQKPEDPS
jgi:hypothetical protein